MYYLSLLADSVLKPVLSIVMLISLLLWGTSINDVMLKGGVQILVM